jgi:ligand-binding sensor domain-containing protein/signal transduction histidine kinase
MLMGLVAAYCAFTAQAIDPHRELSQYMRDHWGSEKGFTGGSVTAVAQTVDGYLWIGTERGLIRFDGLSFRTFPQATPTAFPIGAVQQLVADSQGDLWILLQSTKILRYHLGKFELGREEAEFGITAITKTLDGRILFSSLALGALTYHDEKFEIMNPAAAAANSSSVPGADELSTRLSWATGVTPHRFAEPNSAVISMAQSSDGKLWLGTRDKGLFYMSDGKVYLAGKTPSAAPINCLLVLSDRELWVGTDRGVLRWNGTEITTQGVPPALARLPARAMIRDRDLNVWIGTSRGLIRVNADRVLLDAQNPHADGAVTALFEDREGNVWIGTPRGIDRLSDSAFVTYSGTPLQSESSGPLYIDQEGRTWFAPVRGGLYWQKGEKTGSVQSHGLDRDVNYSIVGSNKTLWIGRQRGGLTRLEYGQGTTKAQNYTEADGLAQNSVYAVYQSRDGAVWAGTLSGGVSRFDGRQFVTYTTENTLASNTVTSILQTRNGTIWFGTSNGLSSLSDGLWRTFRARDGLPSEDVNCLFEDSSGTLWIGTSGGLAFFSSGHPQVPRNLPTLLSGQIFDMAEDKFGWFWIATVNHVLRVQRDKIAAGALETSDLQEYGTEDGLRSTEGVKRSRSVISDPSGNIWFSLSRGLSVVNPSRLTNASAPAIAHIEALSADGTPINLQDSIQVPASPKRITFTYTGLSLAVPDRVRFRYFLEGFDRTWSDPVVTHEAVYTNLRPGPYRFRVLASNSDGLWNGSETALGFEIEPLFWQTWWFRTTCLVLILLSAWGAHRHHLYQVTNRFSARLEERVSERTRIARELHDTLLQSFHGALLRFQAASNALPVRPEVAKQRLDSAIDQAAHAIAEGRNAVQGLRSSTVVTNDLVTALSTLGEELAANETNHNSTAFNVAVEGAERELHPILRDEVYRIAGEALRNAFRHAQARRIELEIRYAENHLRLRIRDDGKGMDARALDGEGYTGHWGLRGMRERTNLVSGNLEVWSKLDSGTEIELSIPASTAYARSTTRKRSWFSRKEAAVRS